MDEDLACVKPDGQNSAISFVIFKMVAPRALVFRPLVKGNEDSGNEIEKNPRIAGFFASLPFLTL